MACLGCHVDTTIKRRSIDDLYGEAIAAAAVRPAQVQKGFQSAGVPVVVESVKAGEADLGVSAARSGPWTGDWNGPAGSGIAEVEGGKIRLAVDSFGDEPNFLFSGAQEGSQANGIAIGDEVVEDSSGRSAARLPAPRPEQKPMPSGVGDQRDDQKRMSDVFDQTDIFEVLQILSLHFQVPIISDDSIGGVVTANVDNETLDEILEKVLMPLGLIHAKSGGRYIVAPPDPGSPMFSYIAKRSTYTPSNHNISALVALLPARYRSFIQSSPDRNMAMIEAPERLLQEIIGRLQELDTPIGQVELEAIVCVVSPDSGFRFGLDWNHVVGVNNAQSLKVGMAGLAMSGSGSRQGVQDAFSDFAVTSAFMRLLAQEGYITIRAAPRVTARDGEKASISLNRETFFSLQPDNSNVFFRQDVQKVEAGISLEIVPRIHGDTIAVEIVKAEVSEDIRSSSNADVSSNPYPIINRRVVSTKVSVRDGHTIVIGGLVQRQTVDRINRIPGLSGLPGVGKLFQVVEKQEQDVEVAVFISPRIVPQSPELCLP